MDVALRSHLLQRSAPILKQIGNTPLIELRSWRQRFPGVRLYVKAEWLNPGGSVKDRPALWMVREGISSGEFSRGKVLLDSTSGNTGIAYAMIGAALGFKSKLLLPANASPERIETIRAYGAEVVLTDPLQGSDGARRVAREISEAEPERYFMPGQYDNPANPKAHFETTGLEIFQQTRGQITHLVSGIGTGGTLMGTGARLRGLKPEVKVIAMEPEEPLHGIEGLKHMASSIKPQIYDENFPDEVLPVSTADAYKRSEELAAAEGLFVGHSAGAAVEAALRVTACLERGVIVAICPDGGSRYISS